MSQYRIKLDCEVRKAGADHFFQIVNDHCLNTPIISGNMLFEMVDLYIWPRSYKGLVCLVSDSSRSISPGFRSHGRSKTGNVYGTCGNCVSRIPPTANCNMVGFDSWEGMRYPGSWKSFLIGKVSPIPSTLHCPTASRNISASNSASYQTS
jgi:hypothetical protein